MTDTEKLAPKATPKPAPKVAPKPDPEQKKFVKHNNIEFFSVRLIRKEQWESIGVNDQETVEWSAANQFKVPVDNLSRGALNYLLNIDDGFEIVTE